MFVDDLLSDLMIYFLISVFSGVFFSVIFAQFHYVSATKDLMGISKNLMQYSPKYDIIYL